MDEVGWERAAGLGEEGFVPKLTLVPALAST